MPTTVTKTIGSAGGRDYTTVQAWEDALPANLVTGDTVQIGTAYNDSEFTVAGAVLTFSGSTTDSTHTITLKCAAGQSFRDNASIQTNALRYNASNGVGLRSTGSYTAAVIISEDNVFLTDLQISSNISGNGNNQSVSTGSLTTVNTCILEGRAGSIFGSAVALSNGSILNSLIVIRTSVGDGVGIGYHSAVTVQGCTIVRPSDITASGSGLSATGSPTVTVQNCAIFGFTASVNNTARFTGDHNCSDVAIGFGTSNQASKTYSTQFVTTTDTARDFKVITGADCVDNGATISAISPDIAGTVRPSGAAYDIGCWELVAAGGGGSFPPAPSLNPQVRCLIAQ